MVVGDDDRVRVEGRAKLVTRLIEAGYRPEDVFETMAIVALDHAGAAAERRQSAQPAPLRVVVRAS
jgi:hypothetical protein